VSNPTVTQPAATVIDTPEGIAMFQLIALRGALRLEVAGMGVRALRTQGGAIKVTQRITGAKFRTKRDALAGVTALIDAIQAGELPAPAHAS